MNRIAALLILACLTAAVFAGPPASARTLSEKEALVVEIGKLSSMDKIVTLMVGQFMDLFLPMKLKELQNDPRWPEIEPKIPQVTEIIKTSLLNAFLPNLDDYLVYTLEPAFSQMTVEELVEVRNSMANPAMKKWLELNLALQPEIQARGQQWASQTLGEAEEEVKRELDKL